MIEHVRGMRDILPEEVRTQRAVQRMLEALQARSGYTTIDLPLLEPRELYLKKLGEELVGKVYEFSFAGRELALRPEWTASVLRVYLAELQERPLPLRISYCGPVFRYERPQRATYRQFTQQGVELIGGPAPRADAEVIALACAGLDAVGLRGYRLLLGHIGLVRSCLAELGLDERTQGFLAWNMEKARRQGVGALRERLREAAGEATFDPALLDGMSDEQARSLLLRVLQALDVNVRFGTRPPEAIIDRLLRKLRRADPEPKIERALAFLEQLSQLQGPPATTLDAVAELLAAHGLGQAALIELRTVIALLRAYGIADTALTLDFGLSRGLHYYTGMIFEIDGPDGLQLCGGGRYDDLVAALGGRQPVPAVGFAYGLDRVVASLQAQGTPPEGILPPEVLVAVTDEQCYPYAVAVARRLQEQGFATLFDVRGRSPASNLRDAQRRQVACLALIGPQEQAAGQVLWREVLSRSERLIAVDDLPHSRDFGATPPVEALPR